MKKKFIVFSVIATLLFTGLASFNFSKVEAPIEEVSAWSTSVTPSVDKTYYSACDGLSGASLKAKLATFNQPKNKDYGWSRYEAADEAQDDPNSIISLYTRHNILKSSHCGNYAWDKWNREHVYTQTAFPNSDDDNHNIFACEGQINGIRGNKKFAEVEGGRVTVFGHLTDCYTNSYYFEPCDEAKGEVARACMYCVIYYGYSLTDIFDSVETAVNWHNSFPVTPREIYRNNTVYSLQKNRNPFVDRPTYADTIFGGDYPEDDPVPQDPQEVVDVTGVSLNASRATITVGETYSLIASIAPKNATNKKVTWTSSDESVAKVSLGTVTGVSEGKATITVETKDGGFKATCEVTVNKEPVDVNLVDVQIISGPTKLTYNVNELFDWTGLRAVATFDDLSELEVYPSTPSLDGISVKLYAPDLSEIGEAIGKIKVIYKEVKKEATFTVQVVGGGDDSGKGDEGDVTPTPTPEKKSGCGGSIIASSVVISLTSLFGLGLLFYKKKRK